jgi:hypothetical protein
VPPDMSGALEDSNSELLTFGNFRRRLRYNSPDCPVYTRHVRCSKEERPPELASLGNSFQLLRYNSSDCPMCTGLSGVTAGQRLFRRQRLPATHLMRARSAQSSGTREQAHRTIYSSCPVRHRTSRWAQRQSSNGRIPTALMTWLSHRTCPVCTGLSGAHRTDSLTKRLVWWLGL